MLQEKTELADGLQQQLAQAEEDLEFHKKRNQCLTKRLEETSTQ